jgi:hypothetical protein
VNEVNEKGKLLYSMNPFLKPSECLAIAWNHRNRTDVYLAKPQSNLKF